MRILILCLIVGFYLLGCSGIGTAKGPASANQSASTTPSPSPAPTLSACAPTVPHPAWTSPYAGHSRGVPTSTGFFPISVWLQGSWHATEMAQMGINVYVGNNAGTDPIAASDLQTLQENGIFAIIGQDSVGLANIDSPVIIGWWMQPDEPDNAQQNSDGSYGPALDPSVLVTEYNSYKTTDPTRPAYLGLGQGVAYDGWVGRGSNAPPESGYVPASDIISFDIYPYNGCSGEQDICGEFWLNAFGVDRLHEWSNRNQAVWTWIETTKMDDVNGPTPVETASEVWLSLIHGANGIGYFVDVFDPSFQEDGVFQDPTMVSALTSLDAEILSLAPELNSTSITGMVNLTSSNAAAPIDSMVKSNGSSIYIFAAISRAGTATGTFTIAGMTGNGVVDVVNENRTINVTAGQFQDSFAANGAHVYKIDMSAVTCD